MSTQEELLVQRLGRLARLSMSAQEVSALTPEMEEILRFMDQIRAIDTRDVPMTQHIAPMENVLRADTQQPVMSQDAVLQAAPIRCDSWIAVPRTVEEGSAG